MSFMDPTSEEARKMKAAGIPFPRGAAWSEAVQHVVAEDEVAALKERVAEAKRTGSSLSSNDAMLYEWAAEKGLILPEKDLMSLPARELMAIGLHQAELDRQGEIVIKLQELTGLAQEYEKATKPPAWDDFPGKVAAKRKADELRGKYKAAVKDVRVTIDRMTDLEYRELAHGHVSELEARLETKLNAE